MMKTRVFLILSMAYISLISACATEAPKDSALKLNTFVKEAYDYYLTGRYARAFAVAVDGKSYAVSYSVLEDTKETPTMFEREALEKCRKNTDVDCVVFANAKSIIWKNGYEWLPETAETSNKKILCTHIEPSGKTIKYHAKRKCLPGDTGFHQHGMAYLRDLFTQPDNLEEVTVRYTIKDWPDKNICSSLPAQNPDYIKEAKRRGLTNEKCSQILGE